MLLNCGVGEDSWESLRLQGDPTVVLETTLESPLDCKEIQPVHRKGNQSWLFIGRMLKLQYFGHLMRRTDSLEKTLMLGKIEGRKRRGRQRMRWLDGIMNSMDMSLSKLWKLWWTGKPGVLQSMGLKRVGHSKQLNWIEHLTILHGPWNPSFSRLY